jgi:hypothetical protein
MDMELIKPLCLAGMLMGPLVVPLYASAVLGRRDRVVRLSLFPIWAGQIGGAAAGLTVISLLIGGRVFGRQVRAR